MKRLLIPAFLALFVFSTSAMAEVTMYGYAITGLGYDFDAETNNFDLAEIELGVLKKFDEDYKAKVTFQTMPSATTGYTPKLKYAYFDANLFPGIGFKLGSIDLPPYLAARSIDKYWWINDATIIGDKIDWGMALKGKVWNDTIEYDLSLSNGDGYGNIPTGKINELEFRLSYYPVYEGLSVHFFFADDMSNFSNTWQLGGGMGYLVEQMGASVLFKKVKSSDLTFSVPLYYRIIDGLEIFGKFAFTKPVAGDNGIFGMGGIAWIPTKEVSLAPSFQYTKQAGTGADMKIINLTLKFNI